MEAVGDQQLRAATARDGRRPSVAARATAGGRHRSGRGRQTGANSQDARRLT